LRVLVVGGGGREHALAWQLSRFHHQIWCAPGNAGIARLAECVPADVSDSAALAGIVRSHRIDLTIVGPEVPLVAGIGDDFQPLGFPLFGPLSAGARLEGDKVFAKELMQEADIPTAGFESFSDLGKARDYIAGVRLPVVIKAAGLAAGKGVVIARTREQAEQALAEMLSGTRFGEAGRTVVIEEFLEGEEASIIGICDGSTVELLVSSQDHKRLRDGDEGPNTGGMGAYAPAPVVTGTVAADAKRQVFEPLLAALRSRGIDYRGVIYAGMMLTADGPKVLEFNCRFGDPETQVIMPLLATDLAELAMACINGNLGSYPARWSDRSALCVVAAAAGYPEAYARGLPVSGDSEGTGDVVVFHAGTKLADGKVVTSGGRVLGVTGLGDTLQSARDRAYEAVDRVSFPGMFFRRDIGARELNRAR
jgi:phosphoribosylamine--glycine ligase